MGLTSHLFYSVPFPYFYQVIQTVNHTLVHQHLTDSSPSRSKAPKTFPTSFISINSSSFYSLFNCRFPIHSNPNYLHHY